MQNLQNWRCPERQTCENLRCQAWARGETCKFHLSSSPDMSRDLSHCDRRARHVWRTDRISPSVPTSSGAVSIWGVCRPREQLRAVSSRSALPPRPLASSGLRIWGRFHHSGDCRRGAFHRRGAWHEHSAGLGSERAMCFARVRVPAPSLKRVPTFPPALPEKSQRGGPGRVVCSAAQSGVQGARLSIHGASTPQLRRDCRKLVRIAIRCRRSGGGGGGASSKT